jgi:hypothetical protein
MLIFTYLSECVLLNRKESPNLFFLYRYHGNGREGRNEKESIYKKGGRKDDEKKTDSSN